jgi:hypothetical protein
MHDAIWRVCKYYAREDERALEAFTIVCNRLQADKFARLSPFRGGRLENYISMIARELLLEHVLSLPINRRFGLAWESLFGREIKAKIAKLTASTVDRDDIYQKVLIKLFDDDYTLLRHHSAKGTLAFFCRALSVPYGLIG